MEISMHGYLAPKPTDGIADDVALQTPARPQLCCWKKAQ